MCISLTPDCNKEQLLMLWHHECDWLYGHRMIDNVDVERYQLAYKTVVKMNFNDIDELTCLNRHVYFSNLKETESGIVVAGLNTVASNTASAAPSIVTSSIASNSCVTDGYIETTDLNYIRKLVQISLNEYNKVIVCIIKLKRISVLVN